MKLHPLHLVLGIALSMGSLPAHASGTTYDLFLTSEGNGNTTANIYEASATVGPTFSLGSLQPIAATGAGTSAGGIAVNPNDGQLLVGGGDPSLGQFPDPMYQVNPTTGAISSFSVPSGGVSANNIAVDPSGNTVWATGGDFAGTGQLASAPINPMGGPGSEVNVTGSDTSISSLAFDPRNSTWYYTSMSAFGSSGDFGTINPRTGVTTALLTNQPGMYDAAYDPFTGDMIAAGGHIINQIGPTGVLLSQLDISGGLVFGPGYDLVQVAPTGAGQIFLTTGIGGTNTDQLLYFDYSQSGQVGNYSSDANIGIGKPLYGVTVAPVPIPHSLALFVSGLGILGMQVRGRKQRKTRAAR